MNICELPVVFELVLSFVKDKLATRGSVAKDCVVALRWRWDNNIVKGISLGRLCAIQINLKTTEQEVFDLRQWCTLYRL